MSYAVDQLVLVPDEARISKIGDVPRYWPVAMDGLPLIQKSVGIKWLNQVKVPSFPSIINGTACGPFGYQSCCFGMEDTVIKARADGYSDRAICKADSLRRNAWSPSLTLTLKTFFKHPATVGSAFPASRWIVHRMLAPIDWKRIQLFVEVGPGTGAFTQAVLAGLPSSAVLLALDTSKAFVNHLRASIDDPRFEAVCKPAANVAAVLRECDLPSADCILSGLPFSTVDTYEAERTMPASRAVLASNGMFCAYQMRRTIEPLLKTYIGPIHSAFEWRNLPPCHLYRAEAGPENQTLGDHR